MGKKVFAIIGIVVGAAAVFVGAVLGVMALMGKFKTPEVYPSSLVFVDSEQTIVYDSTNPDQIYSFILNGYSSSEYEVNQTTCYVDIQDGTDLIELCSKSGQSLSQVENSPNRYIINCNEYTYFKLKDVDETHFEDETFGKIVLQARDEKGRVQSNKLTLWVDRQVQEIYLGDSTSGTYGTASSGIQTITLGLNVAEYFNFVTTPDFALNPISSQEEKIVEIYYLDGTDYVLINSSTYSNYDFLGMDGSQLYFKSADSGSFEFKIAVFDTYASREAYLSTASHSTDSNIERINKMVSTTLTFNVVNSDVDSVSITSSGIVLYLYQEADFNLASEDNSRSNNLSLTMTQDGSNTYVRFNEVDFSLNNSSSWQTSTFSFISSDGEQELKFDFLNNKVYLYGFDSYESTTAYNFNISDTTLTITDSNNNTIVSFSINISESPAISLSDDTGKNLVESLTLSASTTKFYSTSGAVFVSNEGTKNVFTLLNSGSYLDFYVYDQTAGTYARCEDLSYSVTSSGSGREKTFSVTIKNMPELSTNQSLVLGIIVVNSNGEYFFASTTVDIQEISLTFNVIESSVTLTVDYEQDDEGTYQAVYGEESFADIIEVVSGTYTACVFVTEKIDDDDDETAGYDVEVLDNITITIGSTTYVLVGTYDETNGYKNVIKVKEGATNVGTTLYVIQLKNSYNQTAEELITALINANTGEDGTVNNIDLALSSAASYVFSFRAVTVAVQYSIIADKITVACTAESENYISTDDDGYYYVYDVNTTYYVTLSSTISNMLTNIYNSTDVESNIFIYMYDQDDDVLSYNLTSNVSITSVDLNNDGAIVISYQVSSALTNSKHYITFCFNYNGTIIESSRIYITSTAADNIYLGYTDENNGEKYIELSSSNTEAQSANNYILVEIGWDTTNNKYTYTYYLVVNNDSDNKIDIDVDKYFNLTSNYSTTTGFYATPQINGIDVTHSLDYQSADESVLTFGTHTDNDGNSTITISINSVGTAVISIQSEGVVRYLRVVVQASDSFAFSTNVTTVKSTSETLSNIINYTYNSDSIYNYVLDTILITDISVLSFGGGEDVTVTESTNGYIIATTSETEILTITNKYSTETETNSGTWTFTRKSFLNSDISIRFKVFTITGSSEYIVVTFTSDISINKSSSWDYLYQNTTVLLYDLSQAENNTTPVFTISGISSNDGSLKVTFNNDASLNENTTNLTLNDLGTYTVTFTYNESNLATLSFTVLPNLIMTVNDGSSPITLNSDSTYSLSGYISLFQYKTVYGNDTTIVYGSSGVGVYSDNYLVSLSSQTSNNNAAVTVSEDEETGANSDTDYYSQLSVSSSASTSLISLTSGSIVTGWIDEIGASVTETITFLYSGYKLGSMDVTIVNKYSSYSLPENYKNSDDGYTFYAETSISFSLPCSQFSLTSIEYITSTDTQIGLCFAIGEDGKVTIHFITNESYVDVLTGCVLKFTFADSSNKILTYTTTEDITISPYIPTENEKTAYSVAIYNLLSDVFDVDNDSLDSSVTSFVVDSVNTNTEYISTTISPGSNNGGVEFTEITGASVTFDVYYVISYSITINDTTYTYSYNFLRSLTIVNRQTIVVQYPFVDNTLRVSGHNMNFDSSYDADLVLSDDTLTPTITYVASNDEVYDTYSVSTNYEPVTVGQTISLFGNDSTGVKRIKVLKTNSEDEISDTLTIETVAWTPNYQKYAITSGYIEIDSSEGTITFNKGNLSTGSYFYLLFRITSSSGYVAYYGVYLYYKSSTYTYASYNTEIYYQATSNILNITTSGEVFGMNIGSETSTSFDKLTFTSTDFDKLYFYLLEATDLAGSDIYTNKSISRYGKLSSLSLEDITNYTTIKLGVIYMSNSAIMNIGSLIFYLKPIYSESVDTDANLSDYRSNYKTGEYTATISVNADEFTNPFDKITSSSCSNTEYSVTPTLTIIDCAVGYTIGTYTITTSDDNGTESSTSSNAIYLSESDDPILYISGTNIILNKNVNSDLTFTVRYTYSISKTDDNDDGTNAVAAISKDEDGETTDETDSVDTFILIVYYTFEGYSIPTSNTYIVGNWNSTSEFFDNRLNLTSYVGDYKKSLTISNGNNSATIDLLNGTAKTNDDNLGDNDNKETAVNYIAVATTEEDNTENKNKTELFTSITTSGTTGGKVYYVYDSSSEISYLEFEQSTSDYVLSLSITFNDLSSTDNSKTITVTVKAGVSQEFNSTSTGSSASTALTTSIETSAFDTSYPNYVNLKVSNKTDSVYGNTYYIYSIANVSDTNGVTLFRTTVSSCVEFLYSYSSTDIADTDYVNTTTTTTSYNNSTYTQDMQTPTESSSVKISFVHLAKEHTITPIIRAAVKNDDNTYSYFTDIALNFYIKISQTYSLSINYTITDGGYDVFANNTSYTYSELMNYLFTTNISSVSDIYQQTLITNSYRVTVLDTNNDAVTLTVCEKNNECNTLYKVGLTNPNSINYLSIKAGSYMNSASTTTDGVITTTYTFVNTMSNNGSSYFILSNDAGVEEDYYYTVLIAEDSTGVSPSNDTAGETYTSLLINDAGTETSADLLDETQIGRIKDDNTTSTTNYAFYITNLTITIDSTEYTLNTTSTDDEETVVAMVAEESGNYYSVAKNTSNASYVAIYTITAGNYKFTISLNSNRYLYFALSRSASCTFETATVTFTMYGSGGLICEDYKILIYNYTISSDYSSSASSKEVYATTQIKLSEDININSNTGTNTSLSLSDVSISYGTSSSPFDSYYTIANDSTTYQLKDDENLIYTFDSTDFLLKTNAVGATVSVKLMLTVSVTDNGTSYIVAILNYYFTLIVHFQFEVNGETLSGNNYFETYYMLTTSNLKSTTEDNTTTTSFPYTFNFDEESVTTNDTVTYSYDDVKNKRYYTKLSLVLKDLTADTSSINLSNVTITEITDSYINTITNTDTTHTFLLTEDFTGKVELKLEVNTGVGTYTIYWYIYIRGFIYLDYKSTAGANTVLTQSDGEAYTSGTSVSLARESSESASDYNLYMSNTTYLGTNNNINMIFDEGSEELTATASYVILPYDTYASDVTSASVGVANLFKNNSSTDATVGFSYNTSGYLLNSLSVTLPRVTQSSSESRVYYLVIYEITLSYFDNENGPFYVAYKVYNNQTVTPTDSLSNTVNVDTGTYIDSTTSDDPTTINGIYLDLFYYAETYKTDEAIFKLYLEDTTSGDTVSHDIKLDVTFTSTTTYTYNDDGYFMNDTSGFKFDSLTSPSSIIAYTYSKSDNTYTAGSTYTIDSMSTKIESYYSDEITNAATVQSLFKCTFDSILDFQTFIASVKEIKFSNFTNLASDNEDVSLSLVYLTDGRYGVQLYSSSSAKLKFNNVLYADIEVINNDGNVETSINAYDPDSGVESGFRLVASSQIVENTTNITLGSIFLLSELASTADGFTLSENLSEKIIGVGTPDNSWVHIETNGTVSSFSNCPTYDNTTDENGNVTLQRTKLATFKVSGVTSSSDDGVTTYSSTYYWYYLNSVTYTSSSSSTGTGVLYDLTADYYYITYAGCGTTLNNATTTTSGDADTPTTVSDGGETDTNSDTYIVKMDYSTSLQSYYYQVSVNYSTDGDYYYDSTLSLTNLVKCYYMEDYTSYTNYSENDNYGFKYLTFNNKTPDEDSNNNNVAKVTQISKTDVTTTVTKDSIVMSAATLQSLQADYDYAISIDYMCEVTVNSKTYYLQFTVSFRIPTDGTVPGCDCATDTCTCTCNGGEDTCTCSNCSCACSTSDDSDDSDTGSDDDDTGVISPSGTS